MTTFAMILAVFTAMVLLIMIGFVAGYSCGKTDAKNRIKKTKDIAERVMSEGDLEIAKLKKQLQTQRIMEEFHKNTP